MSVCRHFGASRKGGERGQCAQLLCFSFHSACATKWHYHPPHPQEKHQQTFFVCSCSCWTKQAIHISTMVIPASQLHLPASAVEATSKKAIASPLMMSGSNSWWVGMTHDEWIWPMTRWRRLFLYAQATHHLLLQTLHPMHDGCFWYKSQRRPQICVIFFQCTQIELAIFHLSSNTGGMWCC